MGFRGGGWETFPNLGFHSKKDANSQHCLLKLRLPLNRFRTHSLHRGGATDLLGRVRDVYVVVVAVRWASAQSARANFRIGQALHARIQAGMDENTARMIAVLVAESAFVFAQPP